MLKPLDIVSSEGVIDVQDVLGVRDRGFGGDSGGGVGGSRSAGGVGDGEFSRLA